MQRTGASSRTSRASAAWSLAAGIRIGAARTQLVSWLASQAAVANIVLFDPLPIDRMLGDGLGLEFAVAEMRETVPEASSFVIGQVLTGLITRVIFEVQGARHAHPA